MWMLVFAYVFFPIVIVLGLGGALYSWKAVRKSRATAAWPPIQATLMNCDGRETKDSGADSREVVVEYTYTVNRKSYTGNGLRAYYSVTGPKGQALYERLKTCKIVVARYNPDDPSEAYLLTGGFLDEWAFFFAMLLFMMGGALFLLAFQFIIAGSADYASALTVLQ